MADACVCGAYCSASQTLGSCTDEYISNVTFNTINNSSTCSGTPSGYTNYTSISTTIQQGLSYTLTVTNANIFTGDQCHAYFDWNGDGDWADAGEDITLSGGPGTFTFTGTIPSTSIVGVTRMRVRVFYTGATSACGAVNYGEAEDYCLNILAATPCSGPPASSTTIASSNPACYNTAFTLSLGTTYTNSGIAYLWQSAPDVSGSPGTFTNITGATSSTYSASQTATTWYRCRVRCTNTSQNTFSTPLQVTTQLCYCVPVYATGCANDKITNFVLNTLSNNSGTTCNTTPPGYSVYGTSPPIKQLRSSKTLLILLPLPLPIQQMAMAPGVAIWIDYNDNGVFDASEMYNNGATKFASNATGTITISVPPAVAQGPHRLRVRAMRNTLSNAIDPCLAGNVAGEAEDYTVTIGPQVCIAGPTAPADAANICPSLFSGLSWPSFPTATGYDVYFGSSNPPLTLVSPNQPGTTYNPGVLADGATYYWSVVPILPAGGATSCQTWSFTLKPAPDPAINTNSPVCEGTSINLSAINNASGQGTGNSYQWSGPSFSSSQQNPSINGASAGNAGTYTVTITNQFGCTASKTTDVVVSTNPTASIVFQQNVSCNGGSDGSVTVEASGGESPYIYTDGVNVNIDGMFTGLSAGSFSVDISDNQGLHSYSTCYHYRTQRTFHCCRQ